MKENSIEEDMKILEEFIDGLKQYNPKTGKDIKPTQFGEGQRYVYSNVYYAIDHILSDYKRVLKENEEFKRFFEKIIKEYIPDYELEELVNRYKNESFIPRVEVKKILEDRRK